MERRRAIGPFRGVARPGPLPRWGLGSSVAVLGACLVMLGCMSGPFAASTHDGATRLTHRTLGYAIEEPVWATAAGWRRVELDESDLAYRDESGTAVSLASSCPNTRATVATLARHVTIGTPRSDLVAAGPIEQNGAPGWTQTFDTVQDGATIRVKVVTVLADGCIYDWLLVSRGIEPFVANEPAFDSWIESFEPPPDRSGGEENS